MPGDGRSRRAEPTAVGDGTGRRRAAVAAAGGSQRERAGAARATTEQAAKRRTGIASLSAGGLPGERGCAQWRLHRDAATRQLLGLVVAGATSDSLRPCSPASRAPPRARLLRRAASAAAPCGATEPAARLLRPRARRARPPGAVQRRRAGRGGRRRSPARPCRSRRRRGRSSPPRARTPRARSARGLARGLVRAARAAPRASRRAGSRVRVDAARRPRSRCVLLPGDVPRRGDGHAPPRAARRARDHTAQRVNVVDEETLALRAKAVLAQAVAEEEGLRAAAHEPHDRRHLRPRA